MAGQCIFCQTPIEKSNRAKEHIIPQWLQKRLDVHGDPILEVYKDNSGNEVTTRQHTLNSLLAGECCVACNSGWMSSLECEVQPILNDIFNGKALNELIQDEREVVGFWAVKTVVALSGSAPKYSRVTAAQAHFVYQESQRTSRLAPAGVHVVGTKVESNRNYDLGVYTEWLQFGGVDASEQDLLNDRSYKAVLQFDNLLLMVTFLPLLSWRTGFHPGIHFPLLVDKDRVAFIEPSSKIQSEGGNGLSRYASNVAALCSQVRPGDTLQANGDSSWKVLSEAWGISF